MIGSKCKKSDTIKLVFHFSQILFKGRCLVCEDTEEMMAGRGAGEVDTERRRNVQWQVFEVIYSRKSALADNISSLSSGGGGGGASNPALGMGEMGIQYLFHDSDRSSGALKFPLFREKSWSAWPETRAARIIQSSHPRANYEDSTRIQGDYSIMQATKCFELWYKVEMKKYGQIMAEEKSQRISMSQSLNGIHRFLWTLFTWNTMKGPWGNWKIWMKEWG